MEHLHNDELRQRLANTERERDRLAGENLRLLADKAKLNRQVGAERARVRELNEMLEYRVGQYLELKAVLDLRQELGVPDAIRGFYPGEGSS